MAVPVNDNLNICELFSDSVLQTARCSTLRRMVHANFDPTNLNSVYCRQLSSNLRPVNVAIDPPERSKSSKTVNHALSREISRVNDQVYTSQVINQSLGKSFQRISVGIREYTNPHRQAKHRFRCQGRFSRKNVFSPRRNEKNSLDTEPIVDATFRDAKRDDGKDLCDFCKQKV